MLETIKKQWPAQMAVFLFILLSIWWRVSPLIRSPQKERFIGDFPSIYAVVALWGSIWGMVIARKWGGMKSVMGRAIIMFSLGLFAQVFGQVSYWYYSYYQHIATPYPSIGDLGYFGSIPFYIYGVWLLGRASGVKVGLRSFTNKIQAIVIPVIMLMIGYYLFLQGYEFDWSQPLTIFLDFGYPLFQAIYVSLAIVTYLLSRNILGGMMKNKILFILFALVVQFASDYTFLYQASRGTWLVGGFNDYMYLAAYLLMTLGLLQLNTVLANLQTTKK